MRGGSHGTGRIDARRGVRALVTAAVVVAAACGPNPGVTDPPPEPVPTAAQTVWALGDSQAGTMAARGPGWGDRLGPAVFNAAWRSTGAEFVTPGTATGRTVVEDAAWYLAHHAAPERLLVIAGVNDLGSGRSVTEMLDAVDDLQDMLTPVYERVMPGIGPFNKELARVIARYRRTRPGDKRDKG